MKHPWALEDGMVLLFWGAIGFYVASTATESWSGTWFVAAILCVVGLVLMIPVYLAAKRPERHPAMAEVLRRVGLDVYRIRAGRPSTRTEKIIDGIFLVLAGLWLLLVVVTIVNPRASVVTFRQNESSACMTAPPVQVSDAQKTGLCACLEERLTLTRWEAVLHAASFGFLAGRAEPESIGEKRRETAKACLAQMKAPGTKARQKP